MTVVPAAIAVYSTVGLAVNNPRRLSANVPLNQFFGLTPYLTEGSTDIGDSLLEGTCVYDQKRHIFYMTFQWLVRIPLLLMPLHSTVTVLYCHYILLSLYSSATCLHGLPVAGENTRTVDVTAFSWHCTLLSPHSTVTVIYCHVFDMAFLWVGSAPCCHCKLQSLLLTLPLVDGSFTSLLR